MSQPAPFQPCPVERLQAGWFGRQGFTTTDHGWTDGVCRHCGQTREQARSSEHALTLGEFEPNPDRWQSVTRHLSSAR